MTEKTIEIFYRVNKIYSITINPNDKHQFTHIVNYYNRIKKVKSFVRECFGDEGIHFCLHLDISEPRQLKKGTYPRIHFHGVIMFKNKEAILSWLVHTSIMLSQMAYVDIDSLDPISKNKWFKYCMKYDHITNVMPIQHKLGFK